MDRFLQLVPDITKEQVAQLLELEKLIKIWNEKINVVSRKDIEKVREHHIIHSMSIARLHPFEAGSQVIDVGTGGGFPGLPLAILFPDCNFLLVDSITKKIGVVESIIEELELTNCAAIVERMEKVDEEANYVVSRAVAPMQKLINWTKHLLPKTQKGAPKNGWLFLKGGDLEEEMSVVKREKTVHTLTDILPYPHFENKFLIEVPKV